MEIGGIPDLGAELIKSVNEAEAPEELSEAAVDEAESQEEEESQEEPEVEKPKPLGKKGDQRIIALSARKNELEKELAEYKNANAQWQQWFTSQQGKDSELAKRVDALTAQKQAEEDSSLPISEKIKRDAVRQAKAEMSQEFQEFKSRYENDRKEMEKLQLLEKFQVELDGISEKLFPEFADDQDTFDTLKRDILARKIATKDSIEGAAKSLRRTMDYGHKKKLDMIANSSGKKVQKSQETASVPTGRTGESTGYSRPSWAALNAAGYKGMEGLLNWRAAGGKSLPEPNRK